MAETSDAAPAGSRTSNKSKTKQIKSTIKDFNVATFNVRGLTQDIKKDNLATDIERYKVDLCCLQETKIKEGCDTNRKGHQIICFPSESEHYGMGFIIHKKWKKYIYKAWSVNDRIAVIQIKSDKNTQEERDKPIVTEHQGLKMKIRLAKEKLWNKVRTIRRKLKMKFIREKKQERHLITIINVYAPHSEITRKNPEERDELYEKLEEVIEKTKKGTSVLIIAGDFNAEVGKRTEDDICIRRYSSGKRNENGQSLINFCEANDLVLTNTCFQHSQRHRTTWEQTRIINEINKITIRKVLDYITIKQEKKHILQDSRSYQGTLTNSDHRILITRMKIEWYEIYKKVNKKQEKVDRFNTQELANCAEKKEQYKQKLEENLSKCLQQPSWKDIVSTVKVSAKEIIGTRKGGVKQEEYSAEIERLCNEQKKIRIAINNTNEMEKVKELRMQRNKIKKEIKKKLKTIRERNIDEIIKEIDGAPNDVKMYKSIKKLKTPKVNKNIVVHDNKGKSIINEKDKYQAVKKHFQSQLYDENIRELEQFIGVPRPLNRKITAEEIKKSLMRMSNNRAPGADGIPVELLKYGSNNLINEIANIINNVFEEHKDTIEVGESVLVPIPKPNKPEGPKKNLRPINLLKVIRKILSSITLKRIYEKTNKHIQNSQSAYRSNRSTKDVVWAHRFLCAKVQLYKDVEVNVIGIDMSSAFDTIRREDLIEELEKILDEDEQRMCRLLLTKTTITIKFGNHEPETVKTNIGSPQGDALSGTFFNLELENALRSLREKINTREPYIEHSYSKRSSIPTEMEYADDTDFPFEQKEKGEYLKLIVKETLGERNLKVNDDKTEETCIIRERKKSYEIWRKTKKLGSLLGDYEDMKRREQLSNQAMSNIKKLWKKSKANLNRKVKIYKTLVKSVLVYNYETWGLTKSETEELNRIHRKQLRRISPSHWNLKNEKLYEVCNERELSKDMKEARWRTFGHILRLPIDTPCQQAMQWYFEVPEKKTKYPGNQRITLPLVLNNDIVSTNLINDIEIKQFKSTEDLHILRRVAADRNRWKEIVTEICGVA